MTVLKNDMPAIGKTKTGRPAKFQTPESLFARINEYFELLGEQRATISGLCLHLGFVSRQSLYDYAKKEEFRYLINRALLVIEAEYEKMLLGPNPRAAIFALKNMGWNDKVTISINTKIKAN